MPQADSIGEYSSRGSAIHAFLADVTGVGRDEALARVPSEHRPACVAIDVGRLPACDPGAYAAEVAFAYDPAAGTAREIGRGLSRRDAYATLAPGEIPGTADVVGLTVDSVVIADYKTGWADIAPVRRNWQLRFYALCACLAYGRSRAHIAIVRIKDDGTVWADQETIEAFDLDMFAGELAELLGKIGAGAKQLTTGAHCRYCPAFAWCPAQTNLVRALVDKPGEAVEVVAGRLTPETAARAWHALKALKMATDRIDEALRTYALSTPIDLGHGSCLGPCERETTTIDGGVAFHVIRKKFGDEVADKAVTFDVSKASINRAMRVVAQNTGAKISQLEREVLGEIESLNGTTKKRSMSVREHKLKEEVAAT